MHKRLQDTGSVRCFEPASIKPTPSHIEHQFLYSVTVKDMFIKHGLLKKLSATTKWFIPGDRKHLD